MKQKYQKLNLSKLPANIKAEFEDIRKATKDFTDNRIMEIEQENFDSLYAVVAKKHPVALGETKKKEAPKSNLSKALDQDQKGTDKAINKITGRHISAKDIDFIGAELANDEDSSDQELIDHISDQTKLPKALISKIVKSERSKVLKDMNYEIDFSEYTVEPESKKRKIQYDSTGKQELEDGHILLKKSDTEAILQYKGQANKTVVFTFEGGKWIIDCCDKRGDKYPDYSKAELEDAIDYIIGELECKETVEKRKEAVKKRKAYEEKQSKKSEAQKATETVEKAAESVEKKIDSTDKPFPPKAAEKIQDDIVKIVDSIKSAMKSRADSKEFIKGLIGELQKLL